MASQWLDYCKNHTLACPKCQTDDLVSPQKQIAGVYANSQNVLFLLSCQYHILGNCDIGIDFFEKTQGQHFFFSKTPALQCEKQMQAS